MSGFIIKCYGYPLSDVEIGLLQDISDAVGELREGEASFSDDSTTGWSELYDIAQKIVVRADELEAAKTPVSEPPS